MIAIISEEVDRVAEELLDRSLVEACLPCHMMWLATQGLRTEGIEIRSDVYRKLSVGAAAPLSCIRTQPARVSRVARLTNQVAEKVLRQYSPASQEHGLYSMAMFCLKLVDEGLLADTNNMAVLISLLLIDELREAEGGDIRVRESVLKMEAAKLLDLVRREGYYPGPVQLSLLDRVVPAGKA